MEALPRSLEARQTLWSKVDAVRDELRRMLRRVREGCPDGAPQLDLPLVDRANELLRYCPDDEDFSEALDSSDRPIETTIESLIRSMDWLCEQLDAATEAQAPAAADRQIIGDTAHSDGFRSVRWFGEAYSFTKHQAAVVRVLWENWEKGTPDVGAETLLSAVDHVAPPARMQQVFRGHPAWAALIVPGGTKGSYRLAEPQK